MHQSASASRARSRERIPDSGVNAGSGRTGFLRHLPRSSRRLARVQLSITRPNNRHLCRAHLSWLHVLTRKRLREGDRYWAFGGVRPGCGPRGAVLFAVVERGDKWDGMGTTAVRSWVLADGLVVCAGRVRCGSPGDFLLGRRAGLVASGES